MQECIQRNPAKRDLKRRNLRELRLPGAGNDVLRAMRGLGLQAPCVTCAFAAAGMSAALGAPLDIFGPPPPGDPCAYTAPVIGEEAARNLPGDPPANKGAFEGGATGTEADAAGGNSVPPDAQTSFNIPTNSDPSRLFGAQSFTQQMLRFEKFGTEPLHPATAPLLFPRPSTGPAPEQDPDSVARSAPAGAALDALRGQDGVAPFPTEYSNTLDENARRPEIELFLNRRLVNAPAKGRPPGSCRGRSQAGTGWSTSTPSRCRLSGPAMGSGPRLNRTLRP